MRLYFATVSTFQPALVEEGIFSSRKIANVGTRGTSHRLEITAREDARRATPGPTNGFTGGPHIVVHGG